jgi:hypothetical protein
VLEHGAPVAEPLVAEQARGRRAVCARALDDAILDRAALGPEVVAQVLRDTELEEYLAARRDPEVLVVVHQPPPAVKSRGKAGVNSTFARSARQ